MFFTGTFSVYSLQYKKLTSVQCEIGRYQDYFYKSNNISTFKCSKEKSFCTEEGQVTLFRDSPTENNLCYCKNDYIFLKESNNGTYCNPDVENCSCILERTGKWSFNLIMIGSLLCIMYKISAYFSLVSGYIFLFQYRYRTLILWSTRLHRLVSVKFCFVSFLLLWFVMID